MRKLRRPLRGDTEAVTPWIVICIVIVLVVVAVSVLALSWGNMDKFDGNDPDSDTRYVIEANTKIGDFDNQWGKVEARDVDFKLKSYEYDNEDGWFPGLEIAGFWDMWKDEFKFTCIVRCVGPGGFDAEARDVQKREIDDWGKWWGEEPIDFHSLRFFVEKAGRYTLTLEIIVDSPDEGVNDETVASKTKSISVGGS